LVLNHLHDSSTACPAHMARDSASYRPARTTVGGDDTGAYGKPCVEDDDTTATASTTASGRAGTSCALSPRRAIGIHRGSTADHDRGRFEIQTTAAAASIAAVASAIASAGAAATTREK
jgi:hypothetical protein